MPDILDPQLKRDLSERIRYYNELGIYDFYRREPGLANIGETEDPALATTSEIQTEQREEMTPRSKAVAVPVPEDDLLEVTNPKAETGVTDAVQALRLIREDLGDCTRCRLSKQGRKQIVFGVGNPKAELMFIGEAPGADEDQQGEPFVGRAGQLLNSMLRAMGSPRETVYIANVLKCRPPGNRDPRPEEVASCLGYLQRQVDMIQPRLMLAVGRIAAQNLLATDTPIGRLRGQLHRFGARATPLIVTYHPAYLLRSPGEKRKAWIDLKFVRAQLAGAPPGA